MNGDEWIALSIFAEQATKKGLRRRADVAETEFTLFSSRRAPDTSQRLFEVLQQQRRFAQQDRAGGRDSDMMARTFEHGRAQEVFELFDGAA